MTKEKCDFHIESVVGDWSTPALECALHPVFHRVDMQVQLVGGGFETGPAAEELPQPQAPLAEWEAEATGLDSAGSYTRRESGTFASPAMHIQRWELEAGGTKYSNIRTHAITPETDMATHIFMYASYNYTPNDETVATTLQSLVGKLVERDTVIMERVAAHTGYDGWRSGVEFQADAAALRARGIVAVMLAKEAGRSALRPGWAKAKSLITN
jgi:vanillate O-demethylase monooxygenase subunit